MGIFAWRNLLTRPIRTILALVGLSIPVLGCSGYSAVSNSLRNLVGDTLGGIEGLVVLSDNALSPVFSNVPASLPDELRKMPTMRAVAPRSGAWPPRSRAAGMIAGMFTPGKGIVDLRPAGDRRPGHRGAPEPPQRHLPQGPARARRGAVPPPGRRGAAEHRHQPQDRPRTPRRRRASPGRWATPSRSAASRSRSSASTRPARCCWTSSSSWTSPRLAEVLNRPEGALSCIYVEGDDPAPNRRAVRRDREGQPRLRRPQHGRGPGQFQQPAGADRHVPADDGQPGAAWSASWGSSTPC